MPHARRSLLLVPCGYAFLAGCGLVQGAAETPGNIMRMVFPGTQTSVPPPDQVLKDLLRYADQIALSASVALREFKVRAGTPEAAIQATEWQLEILRLSTQSATRPNSLESLLDLSVQVTLAGWLQEDLLAGVWGEALQPVQRALADLRDEGWRLLQRNCDKKHLEEMHELLRRWRQEHPQLTHLSILELPRFTSLLQDSPAVAGNVNSLLGIVGLDPLAGLEPAAREIEQSRETAERLLFFVERAPQLVALEIELGVLKGRQSDEARQVLTDFNRFTNSVESFSATAASLPAAIGVEREAAVRQLNETLAQQRAGLLRDLETAQAPLGSVLQQTQAALAAGERTSAELTGTLKALDAFVARFQRPASAVETPAQSQSAPPVKRFDVADYGIAAERVGLAANQLTSLVAAIDQRLPEVQRILGETADRSEQAIDHATTRLLMIGLALIAAAALAVLLVRRIGPRRAGAA